MKQCTGCGRIDNEPLGLNKNGEPFLACCPDNNYVEMKQKTAVQFLFSELERCQYFIGNDIYEAYKEALQKEKEQLESSFHIGIIVSATGQRLTYNEYYKRNYLEDEI